MIGRLLLRAARRLDLAAVAVLVELAGAACLVAAAWWWQPKVGLASAGVALILAANASDGEGRPPPPPGLR